MKHLILFSFLFLGSWKIFAQNSAKLFGTDSMFIGDGGNISIWGNFYNAGNSSTGGSLIIKSNGYVKMYGDTLQNMGASQIAGTGSFEMIRPRPTPYASSLGQTIISGGPTMSFSNFTVNTTAAIQLKNYDLKVRDTLKFISGCLVLNNNDLILGNGYPGVITGYNQNSFVVTNNNTRDTLKGFLKREQIGSTSIVFPIGQAIGDYTPAMIQNTGTTDDFKVRVFDSVYEDGYVENLYAPSNVQASLRSVQRTWDIREGIKGGSNVNLTLQYNTATEPTIFSNNRSRAFISHYTGVYPNTGGDTVSNWKWDLFKRNSTAAPSSSGTLTTGSAIASAAMKSRSGITSFSPFSITTWFAGATPLPVQLIAFDAEWVNNNDAMLAWTLANPEIISEMTLERSLDNGSFETINKFAAPKQQNNFNMVDIGLRNMASDYAIYRLKLIELNGSISYSDEKILKIKGKNSGLVINAFPNPANKSFNLILDPALMEVDAKVTLTNSLGQIVFEYTINENSNSTISLEIPTLNLSEGIYHLNINSSSHAAQQKLIIMH